MVNRIQNRNPGYSDNFFKNPNIEQSTISSIDGATALKLDQQLEIDTSLKVMTIHYPKKILLKISVLAKLIILRVFP